jgi:hypothetical protein
MTIRANNPSNQLVGCVSMPIPGVTSTRPWTILVVPVAPTRDKIGEATQWMINYKDYLTKIFKQYIYFYPFATPLDPDLSPYVYFLPYDVAVAETECLDAGNIFVICEYKYADQNRTLEKWNLDVSFCESQKSSPSISPLPNDDREQQPCKQRAAAIVGLIPNMWHVTTEDFLGAEGPNQLNHCPDDAGPTNAILDRNKISIKTAVVISTDSQTVNIGDPDGIGNAGVIVHEVGHGRGLVPTDRDATKSLIQKCKDDAIAEGHNCDANAGDWGWNSLNGATYSPAPVQLSISGDANGDSNGGGYLDLNDYQCLFQQIEQGDFGIN